MFSHGTGLNVLLREHTVPNVLHQAGQCRGQGNYEVVNIPASSFQLPELIG